MISTGISVADLITKLTELNTSPSTTDVVLEVDDGNEIYSTLLREDIVRNGSDIVLKIDPNTRKEFLETEIIDFILACEDELSKTSFQKLKRIYKRKAKENGWNGGGFNG